MSRLDLAAFVGRADELRQVAALFAGEPAVSVVLVHGPAGIGKSTLLRQVAALGREAGWTPVAVEGRDLPPVPDALEAALGRAHELERPLVLIDTYERMVALGGHLRSELLPALPERAIVVVAGRNAPERGWFEGGWEAVTLALELGPLSPGESEELLDAHGLSGGRAGELARWAGGSPLALTMAADAARQGSWSPQPGAEPAELVRQLVRRLADAEIDAAHRDTLAVACIARVTTPSLLADVLPEGDPGEAMIWLEARSFSEALGGGLTLHDLVRRALRADLMQREPERERELRRRIADSIYARAVRGWPMLTVDLAELVLTPQIRAFYGWEGSVRNRVDGVRPGDAEQVALLLGGQGLHDWWDLTRSFFAEAPETVAIARDGGGALCGYSISVTPAGAPAVAEADPLLGPWLEHARKRHPDGNAIVWRDAVDFTRDVDSQIQAMINMAGVLRSGLANPAAAYLPVDPALEELRAFLSATRAEHIEELDFHGAGWSIECHVLDYGAGGLLGLQRDTVYLELGMAPPGTADASAPAAGIEAGPEAVRDALRNLRVPVALAASPLARGEGTDERAASVRELLSAAAGRAFGDTEGERLMRRVLERGYLDPAATHEQAADELNLSRAAYFRRLKLASERLAEYLGSR